MSKKIEIEESKLQSLLDKLKNYESKEDEIANCCFKALSVIGLIDKNTGDVIPELKTGENVTSIIIRSVKDSFSVSDFLFNKAKAENDLAEKFSFLKQLLPIFEDYARRKQRAA